MRVKGRESLTPQLFLQLQQYSSHDLFHLRIRMARGCRRRRGVGATREQASLGSVIRRAWRESSFRSGANLIGEFLDVIQMMDRDVIAGDRAAHTARPKSHRGHHPGGIAGCSERSKRIDHDAENGLLQSK